MVVSVVVHQVIEKRFERLVRGEKGGADILSERYRIGVAEKQRSERAGCHGGDPSKR
jgi:hypothetical protein